MTPPDPQEPTTLVGRPSGSDEAPPDSGEPVSRDPHGPTADPGRDGTRRRSRTALVVLVIAAAVILGGGLRLDSISHKHGLHVDEAWSYITATGHLGNFDTGSGEPLARWVPAASWQALWHPGAVVDFRQISLDLAHYDVHPALYFWVLHVWVEFFGVNVRSGPLLNLLIDLATGAALFGLARRLLHDPLPAALVALTWAVSPAVRLTSSMARMYPLLALFAVLFVWLLLIAAERGRVPRRPLLVLVLLALATAGGMLTQYQFILIVAGGVLLAVAWLARAELRRCLGVLAALAGGLVLTALVQPGVYAQFRREQAKPQVHVTPAAFVDKVDGAAGCLFDFFGLDRPWFTHTIDKVVRLDGLMPGHHLSALALLAFWLVVAAAVALPVPAVRRWLWRRDRTGWLAFVLIAWIAGTIVLQNLAFLSQPKVLSPRYLAVAWPFLAFMPLLLARFATRRAAGLVAVSFVLVCSVALVWGPLNYASSPGPGRLLASAHRAVIDCPIPGALPIVMWSMPAQAQVYVAPPGQLLNDPAPWIDVLGPGDYYVHRDNGKANPLALLQSRHALALAAPARSKIYVYELRRP